MVVAGGVGGGIHNACNCCDVALLNECADEISGRCVVAMFGSG